jgi:hypothetical protein
MTSVAGVPAEVIGPRRNTYQEAVERGERIRDSSSIGRIEQVRKRGDWLK